MTKKVMEKLGNVVARKYRGLKSRSSNQLAHGLLSALVKIPPPWQFAVRNILFTHLPSLFIHNPAYLSWEAANRYFLSERHPQVELIDLANVPLSKVAPDKKVAIQIHLFYPELASELALYLKTFPIPFDLLISTSNADDEELIHSSFADLPKMNAMHLLITPNRGRDFAPLLVGFGTQLLQYDYVAHLHTKKSIGTNSIGDAWRQYLYQGLLDCSDNRMIKILGLLEHYGLIYPQKFPLIDVQNCQWGSNYDRSKTLFTSLGIDAPANGYVEFPVGSMFWANTQAIKPLLEHSFALEDFEAELGQTDNTLMHTLERSLSHIALSQGYPIGILPYQSRFSYYP